MATNIANVTKKSPPQTTVTQPLNNVAGNVSLMQIWPSLTERILQTFVTSYSQRKAPLSSLQINL